jgi:hypothetical protein
MRLQTTLALCLFTLSLTAQTPLPLDSLLLYATRAGLIQAADQAPLRAHYAAVSKWQTPNVEPRAELALLDWLGRQQPPRLATPAQLRQARLISADTEQRLNAPKNKGAQPPAQMFQTAKSLYIREQWRYGASATAQLELLKKQNFVSEKALETLEEKIRRQQPYSTADIAAAYHLKCIRLPLDTAGEVAEKARLMFEALLQLTPELKVTQWTITPETRNAERFELRFKANGLEYAQTLNWHFESALIPGTAWEHNLYPQLPLGLLNKALLDMGSDERLFLLSSWYASNNLELWASAVSRRQFKNIQDFFKEQPDANGWLRCTPARFMENSGERASMFARWQRYGLLTKSEMIRATNAWPLIEEDLSKDIEERPASREYLYLLYIKTADATGQGSPQTAEQFKAGMSLYLGKLSKAQLMNDTLAQKIQSRIGNVLDDGTILIPADIWVLIQAIEWGQYQQEQPQLDSLLQEGRQRRIFAAQCRLHLPLERTSLDPCWHSDLPHFTSAIPPEAPTLPFLKTQLEGLVAWFNQYFPDEKIEAIEISQQSGGENALSSVVVSGRMNGNPVFYEYAGLPEYVQIAPFLSGFMANLTPFYKHSYYYNDPALPDDAPCLYFTWVLQEQMSDENNYPVLHALRLSRRDAHWLADAWRKWLGLE